MQEHLIDPATTWQAAQLLRLCFDQFRHVCFIKYDNKIVIFDHYIDCMY